MTVTANRARIEPDVELGAWAEMVRKHDLQYQFSDDPGVYRRGAAQRALLLKEAKNHDPKHILVLVEVIATSRLGPEEGPKYLSTFREDLEKAQ